jgi:hypothetical protein
VREEAVVAIVKTLRCNNCAFEEDHGNVSRPWLTVNLFMSSQSQLVQLYNDTKFKTLLENSSGGLDFCSFNCLASWAEAQSGLKVTFVPMPSNSGRDLKELILGDRNNEDDQRGYL